MIVSISSLKKNQFFKIDFKDNNIKNYKIMKPVLRCGGCNYIYTKIYGYSDHVCPPKPVEKKSEDKSVKK